MALAAYVAQPFVIATDNFLIFSWFPLVINLQSLIAFAAYTVLIIFLYFADPYILLMLHRAEHYLRVEKLINTRVLRAILLIANLLLDLVCLVIFILFVVNGYTNWDNDDPTVLENNEQWLDFSLTAAFFVRDLFTAVLFAVFGWKFSVYAKNFPMGSAKSTYYAALRVLKNIGRMLFLTGSM